MVSDTKSPRVSVICPARGRPEYLRSAVDSLLSRAAHPEQVELLFRFDEDDPSLAQEIDACFAIDPCDRTVISVGPRHGYVGLYRYYNELSAMARGEWLLLWNDDTTMVTDGWDDLLLEGPQNTVQFLRVDSKPEADPTFPATHRGVYEAMGHLSLNAHCDAWISDVSWWAGCQVLRNDIVFHHHLLADETAQGRVDDMPRFKGPEQVAVRAIDIERVKALHGGKL